MSLLRKAGVVVLVLLLTTSFVTANAVAAAHLTVLDPEFVTTSIEEEGGYELVGDTLREGMAGGASAGGAEAVDVGSYVEDALSDEYIRSQTNANVNRTYAYLHGNTDELNLSLSTAPIRENLTAGFESEIRNASLAELLAQSDAELAGPVDANTLERMTESQQSYQQAKADVRADVREPILDEAVDRAFEESSNDELVRAAGEDPDQYSEAEKERFVREYEPQIRDGLRDRIKEERGDEIDAQVDQRLETRHEDVSTTDADTDMERATADVQAAVVNGLMSDTTYAEFQDELSGAKADLAEASADQVDEEVGAEFPDRIDLLGEQSDEPPEPFQQARTAVVWFDRLTLVLPVAIVGLVGLLYHVRRSVASVASDTGISMLLAGLPTFVAVEVGRSQLDSLVAGAPPDQQQLLEVATGLVGRGLGTVSDLGLALTVGGVVLVGVSLAIRYGLLDGLLGSGDSDVAGDGGIEGNDPAATDTQHSPDGTGDGVDGTVGADSDTDTVAESGSDAESETGDRSDGSGAVEEPVE